MKEVINPNYFVYVGGRCVGVNIYEEPTIHIVEDDDNTESIEKYIEQMQANDY